MPALGKSFSDFFLHQIGLKYCNILFFIGRILDGRELLCSCGNFAQSPRREALFWQRKFIYFKITSLVFWCVATTLQSTMNGDFQSSKDLAISWEWAYQDDSPKISKNSFIFCEFSFPEHSIVIYFVKLIVIFHFMPIDRSLNEIHHSL